MRRATYLAAAAATILGFAPACTATVSDRGVSGIPGEEVWKTQVDLRLGEVAYVDGGALQVVLEAVDINEARIVAESRSGTRREILRTGPAGAMAAPPYEIRLLSTSIGGSATIEVRRQFGQ